MRWTPWPRYGASLDLDALQYPTLPGPPAPFLGGRRIFLATAILAVVLFAVAADILFGIPGGANRPLRDTPAREDLVCDWSDATSVLRYVGALDEERRRSRPTPESEATWQRKYEEALEKAYHLDPDREETRERLRALLGEKRDDSSLNVPTIADPGKRIEGKSVADKHYALGIWAKNHGMKKEADALFDYILKKLDRHHVQAARELGLVLVFGHFEPQDIADEIVKMREEDAKRTPHERKVRDWVRAFKQIHGADSFAWLDATPYLICEEKNSSWSAESHLGHIADTLHALLDSFRKEYPTSGLQVLAEDDAEPLVVWVCSSQEKFVAQTGSPDWAHGQYNASTKGLTFFHRTESPEVDWLRLGAHQLLDHTAILRGNNGGVMYWFTEGVAAGFGSFRRDKSGTMVVGILDADLLGVMRGLLETNRHVPLDAFVHLSFDEFRQLRGNKPPETREVFQRERRAEAWSLVYFLRHGQGGKYEARFQEYFEREMNGEGGYVPFTEIFPDLKSLESEWFEYVRTMKDS